MLSQIELLGQSNKTAYTFCSRKIKKILPIKQQQIFPNTINWKKVYENKNFSTTKTKLKIFSN